MRLQINKRLLTQSSSCLAAVIIGWSSCFQFYSFLLLTPDIFISSLQAQFVWHQSRLTLVRELEMEKLNEIAQTEVLDFKKTNKKCETLAPEQVDPSQRTKLTFWTLHLSDISIFFSMGTIWLAPVRELI